MRLASSIAPFPQGLIEGAGQSVGHQFQAVEDVALAGTVGTDQEGQRIRQRNGRLTNAPVVPEPQPGDPDAPAVPLRARVVRHPLSVARTARTRTSPPSPRGTAGSS